MARRVFHCRDVVIVSQGAGLGMRLNVQMLSDHDKLGGRVGERTTTSRVRSIDFERGIAYTHTGSVYLFEPMKFEPIPGGA